MDLCTICVDILQGRASKHLIIEPARSPEGQALAYYRHHYTISSLHASVTQRCRICCTFWLSLPDWMRSSVNEANNKFLSVCNGKLVDCCTNFSLIDGDKIYAQVFPDSYLGIVDWSPEIEDNLRRLLGDEQLDIDQDSSYLFLIRLSSSLDERDFGVPCVPNTAEDETWCLAMRWMNECTATHERCNRASTFPDWVPTRLIDVQSVAPDVRVVISSECHPSGNYNTLSHCWGPSSDNLPKLLRQTLAAAKQTIRLTSLPKTFVEAICVTRKLGVRYLWVDSLCILQDKDDPSDWIKEAQLMERVYSNAYCNISATGSSSSSGGLFHSRDPTALRRLEVEANFSSPLRIGSGIFTIIDLQYWEKAVHSSPVNVRAWVLQERLLARRVLYFGTNELLWECHENDTSESFPNSLPYPLNVGMYGKFKGYDSEKVARMLVEIGDKYDECPMHALWQRVVQSYSRSRLTFSSDKLVALSGLAKGFTKVLQNVYVAGLWQSNLASQLVWHVNSANAKAETGCSRLESIYRAPSWSWASIDEPVSIPHPSSRRILATVQSFTLNYATEDNTSLLKGGSLVLEGCLGELEMWREVTSHQWRVIPNKTGKVAKRCLVYLDDHRGRLEQQKESKGRSYYIPIRYQHPPDFEWLVCLLVELADAEKGVFKRFGVMQSMLKETHELLLTLSPEVSKFPCIQFDLKMKLHTIKIV